MADINATIREERKIRTRATGKLNLRDAAKTSTNCVWNILLEACIDCSLSGSSSSGQKLKPQIRAFKTSHGQITGKKIIIFLFIFLDIRILINWRTVFIPWRVPAVESEWRRAGVQRKVRPLPLIQYTT